MKRYTRGRSLLPYRLRYKSLGIFLLWCCGQFNNLFFSWDIISFDISIRCCALVTAL
ncbi:MAG: hypothetical protein LBK06_02515 [Planctomycetaceae bacterium]|nr:hypothetical protein [Planctomycetaceae bacterium]